MIKPDKISLRPFSESLKKLCEKMSRENFTDFLLHFARTIPPGKRMEFLDNLSSFSSGRVRLVFDETIFDKIAGIKERVMKRAAAIEDGTPEYGLFDDGYDWEEYGYDEEPHLLSPEEKAELESCFAGADELFLAGRLAEAGDIYRELYSLDVAELDIEHRETRAHFCRCLYETSAAGERADALLKAIDLNPDIYNSYRYLVEKDHRPLFMDIKNAGTGGLPGEKEFLEDWIKALKKIHTHRACLLLSEAVYLQEGAGGLEAMIAKQTNAAPAAYLYGVLAECTKQDWKAVTQAAGKALANLGAGDARALIAERLITAGEKLAAPDIILEGRRELFYSEPLEKHLYDFLLEADRQQELDAGLKAALAFLQKNRAEEPDMEIKILLMQGKLDAAFKKAARMSAVGWSSTNKATAVLFAGVLTGLAGKKGKDAEVIKMNLLRYSRPEVFGCEGEVNKDNDEKDFFCRKISDRLADITLDAEQEKKYLNWARSAGRKRIDHIVSNQHRNAYAKAAEVLVGLAECLILLEKKKQGLELIRGFRDDKFRRHTAFRQEVNRKAAASGLLKINGVSRG